MEEEIKFKIEEICSPTEASSMISNSVLSCCICGKEDIMNNSPKGGNIAHWQNAIPIRAWCFSCYDSMMGYLSDKFVTYLATKKA